ncbi:hypothetical protein ACSXAY_18635 (plasmid) [Clostridium perfringens]
MNFESKDRDLEESIEEMKKIKEEDYIRFVKITSILKGMIIASSKMFDLGVVDSHETT